MEFPVTYPVRINGQSFHDLQGLRKAIGDRLAAGLPEWEMHAWKFLDILTDPYTDTISFQTSGTTGPPKTITFQKPQLAASAAISCRCFRLTLHDTALLALPAHYVAGRMMLARCLFSGMPLYMVQPSLSPDLPEIPISFAAFTPAQVITCLAENKEQWLRSIQTIIIGGGELPVQTEMALSSWENAVYVTYGMTETLTHVAIRNISGGEKIFRAVDDSIRFSTDIHQCLQILAPHISPKIISTHDIVEILNDAEFTWLGRRDHVINSGGVKLHPEQIEKKLVYAGLPEDHFYISSQKDDRFGELPVLVIETKDLPDLFIINTTLGKFEKISAIIHQPIRRTETGKIIRERF